MAKMEYHGLPVPEGYVRQGRYDDGESVRGHVRALLDMDERPSCILLPDDAAYYGALEAVRERGLRVPEDVSLAGYDGVRSVQVVHPRLTTIRQDSDAMGRQAAQRLIDYIVHPATAQRDPVLIPSELLEGESMGKNSQP